MDSDIIRGTESTRHPGIVANAFLDEYVTLELVHVIQKVLDVARELDIDRESLAMAHQTDVGMGRHIVNAAQL